MTNLVLNGFNHQAITIDGPGMISNCYVGTDMSGKASAGNSGDGISIGGSGVTVTNNVASGNSNAGLAIDGPGITGVKVFNHKIGVGLDGLTAIANGDGVFIGGGQNIILKNVISGNGGDGIHARQSDGNSIRGNFIGTDPTGKKDLHNGGQGLSIESSNNNIIGGLNKGDSNLIAFNTNKGIRFDAGSGNLVQANSIFSNGGLGISLSGNANGGQVAPVISTAGKVAGKFTITGSLAGAISSSIILDFYSNKVADPSGAGEGQTFLGEVTVTTDATGNFTAVLTKAPAAGSILSLTARFTNGTSAFSVDKTV